MPCRHREVPVIFPDGTQVLASSYHIREQHESAPDFGLYLYEAWRPWWPAQFVNWPDYSLPADERQVRLAVHEAMYRAKAGQRVEIACHGGHGRTGSVLARMAILSGVHANEAVQWVRDNYCSKAVETDEQAEWVRRSTPDEAN